jgi:MFS family permease
MRPTGSLSVRSALRVINAASFLFSSAGAFFLLLPVYLQQVGSTPSQIGLVAGLFRIGSLLARPLAGGLLERFGRRPVSLVGAGVAILSVLSLFPFPRPGGPFFAMRVLQGVGTALVDSGLGAMVADLSPPLARAQVFAIYTVWMNLAGVVMPAVGEAIARHGGFFWLFGGAALLLTAVLLIVQRLPETGRPGPEQPQPPRGLVEGAGPLLLGGAIIGLAFGVLTVFVPVARIAAAPGRAGLFFFAYFAGLIGARLASGLGPGWIARRGILLPAYAVLAAGLAVLPLGDSILLLVGVGLTCGLSHGVLMPVIFALLLFGVSRGRRGWTVALLAAAFDLGNVVGTMGLGLIAERLGYTGIFLLAAGIVAAGAAVAHWWWHR